MGTAGQQLFQTASSALWDLLNRLRSDAAAVLALPREPGFDGPPLNGRLLQAIRPNAISSADPAVAVFLSALQSVLPDIDAPGVPVSLHGFDPGGGQPLSLALVATIPAPAVTIVAALTGAGGQGIAFEIAAVGAGPFGPLTLNLLDNWSLAISGDVGGGARLQLPRGGPAQVLDPGGAVQVKWSVQRSGITTTFGPDSGPNLKMPSLSVSAETALDGGGAPTITYSASMPSANLALSPDFLSALIGDSLSLPIDLDLAADPADGIRFRSGGVKATVPVALNVPGIKIDAVDIGVESQGSGLNFTFGVNFTGSLGALPISFTVDGLGASFPMAVGSGALGIDPGGVRPAMPTGIGLDLTLPVLSGGGFLEITGPGGFGGVLQLDLIELAIQAFGLLQLPVNGQPLSFVAIISVFFPLPGIQLGFGFSLNAVGGVVAINRRVDSPSLEAAVVDGSVNQLLFPVDPASHGPAIVATLGRVFPAAEGHLVIGPMLQIGWGGRIITLSVAIIIDLPSPLQLLIIGRLELALPDPAAPLVLIQATIVGAFEFSPVFSVVVVASLEGSYIVGMPLHGDFLFLLRTGDDAAFVLSVGGFHPRYVPPPGVPNLHRIQLDILPPGFPGLRSAVYFAVTSNTVQFGAHLELCDEIAGCGVDGWFDFDALFQWDPVFAFAVHCNAGVAVQVIGETLMGISFDLIVEGPTPWHIHGSGSIDLFLFSASLDFDVHWGPDPPVLPKPDDLDKVLAAALANPSAWVGSQPRGDDAMVTLSRAANDAAEGQQAVHPLGGVVVRQRVVPFGIEVARYQNQPITPQTWTISAVEIAPGQPASLNAPTFDQFPAGAFLNLTEDEKLSRPAFESFLSGTNLTEQGVVTDLLRTADTSFETILIPNFLLGGSLILEFDSLTAEAFLAVDDPHAVSSLWLPQISQVVGVLPFQPVVVASTSTMQTQAVATATGGFTETLQAAALQFGKVGQAANVQLVERWEVSA